jgi:hypothetical protein
MLQNDIDYAVHVMMQGYQISIGATRLATTNDDGYIDIYEFDGGNYQIVYEEFIKF